MAAATPTCLACEIVAGRVRPPGGIVARWPGFVLHGVPDGSPVAGWLVLTPERHVRGLYDLAPAEAMRLGAIAGEVLRAQRRALRAEHAYAAAFGEVLLHAHLHLIPRPAGTPEHLRGPLVFRSDPSERRPPEEIEEAARAVAAALREARDGVPPPHFAGGAAGTGGMSPPAPTAS